MAGIVNILLSTYNGMRFLDEQLDSLLAQSYPYIKITVRDDGSTDGTYERLLEYARRHSSFEVIRGENLGVVRSYLSILQGATPDCDFYAFCDQDDVWSTEKIRCSVTAIEAHGNDKPVMYCGRLEYVDSQLHHLGYSKPIRKFGFPNALVQNVITGCTVMLNREAREIISRASPSQVMMHDWWCYLVVSAFGKVIYDERSHIKYRQHGSNTVGHSTGFWKVLRRILARYLDPDKSGMRPSDQAVEFYGSYAGWLKPTELRILKDFLEVRKGIWPRIKYAGRMVVWKQARAETASLRLRIVSGRI